MNKFLLVLLSIIAIKTAFGQVSADILIIGNQQEPLAGATIATDQGIFAITDDAGKAQVSCQCDSLTLLISYVGYEDLKKTIAMPSETVIQMVSSDIIMDDIVITAQNDASIITQSTNKLIFNMESTSHLPYLLGERDPVKFIQTQSGVSSGTDGNNGYFVRGGGIDQNAIELDHMEFYNTNHLFGFFSMFNANATDHATFVKGGYPGHIGGRLSSMLQLSTIDPTKEKLKGNISIGLLSASVSVETPIIRKKSGLLVSYRRSYFDLITQNTLPENSNLRKTTDYRFSDMIVKYQHKINTKNTLSLTVFTGGDESDYQSNRSFSNQINWNNQSLGLIWTSIISDRTDFEFYVNGGRFKQNFKANISSFGMDLHSDIQNLKSGLTYYHNLADHELTFGLSWINRRFKPSQVNIDTGKSSFALDESEYIYTSEWAISLDDEWKINNKLQLGIALRVSGFLQIGPFERLPASDANSSDTLRYTKGQVVQDYYGFEPRVRMVYLLNKNSSLKVAYDRTYQYIHLSPLSSISLPTDLWVPSTSNIKPQNAHQLTMGYFKKIENKGISYNVEAFGKLLYNQMEWENGAIAGYSDSPNFDDDFIFGKGYSYGIEFSLKKESDKFSGELNYTLSKTVRQFDAINNGKLFPAKYDRRHDVNLIGSYFMNQWIFSGLFKLASGTALTLPTAKYLIGERVISEYSTRNGLRMPSYHRLDLSATLAPKSHPNVKWIFSVYNAYNHKNPYFIYFDVQGDVNDYSLDINLEEVSLFPVLPAISYQLKF